MAQQLNNTNAEADSFDCMRLICVTMYSTGIKKRNMLIFKFIQFILLNVIYHQRCMQVEDTLIWFRIHSIRNTLLTFACIASLTF